MKKILIIDDEEDFCFFVKKNLELSGDFEVNTCSDSRKAVSEIKKMQPDLVLLDMVMPYRDGPDIAIDLGNSPETVNIPIVFLTATVVAQETKVNRNVIGGRHFVSKPVDVNKLIKVMNEVLI